MVRGVCLVERIIPINIHTYICSYCFYHIVKEQNIYKYIPNIYYIYVGSIILDLNIERAMFYYSL